MIQKGRGQNIRSDQRVLQQTLQISVQQSIIHQNAHHFIRHARNRSNLPLYFGNGWGIRIDKVLLGSTILSVDLDRVQGIGKILRHALTAVETLQAALLVLDKFAILSLWC